MKRAKKSNNIFSQPILPESLYYQQVQKDYRIGGVKVQGCWLKNTDPQTYRASVRSAVQLSQMKNQLDQLNQKSKTNNDMFKIAELKQKIENFQLMDIVPQKHQQDQNWNVIGNNLKLQKLSNFWGIFQRKCKIEGKKIFVFSQKQKTEKVIDLQDYIIDFEYKGKTSKQSQEFVWIQKQQARLFIHNQKLRTYCIYGQEKKLKQILKKMKIQSVKIKQPNFFKQLAKQYEQKMFVLFGNKLRIYEHIVKEKQKQNLNIAFDLIQKSNILDQVLSQSPSVKNILPDKILPSLQQSVNLHSQSSVKSTTKNKSKDIQSSPGSPINATSSLSTPIKSPITQSQFRMRARRSTINYQDIQNQEQILDFKVTDFRLQIKQVTYSDEQRQNNDQNVQQVTKINIIDAKQQNKKKIESKKNAQQLAILQYVNQQQFSDENSLKESQANQKKILKMGNKQANLHSKKFLIIQKNLTHTAYIEYFQDFYNYSANQLQLTFFQKVIPQVQYQNMKFQVCTLQKIILRRKENTKRYLPEKPIKIKVSKFGEQLGILFNNQVAEIKQQFSINLKKIVYSLDQSQLIYIKFNNAIQCAGKLKMIISPNQMEPKNHVQMRTEEFLNRYLIKQTFKREDKYVFIDSKKRHLQVCQRWHHKLMNKIVNNSDQKQFQKAIFYGFPQIIFQKLVNNYKNYRSLTRVQTRVETSSTFYSSQCLTLMENQISKLKAYDLRIFIKIQKLIDLILTGKKNIHFQKRIQQVTTFLSLRHGRGATERFMMALVIQILRKNQFTLLALRNSKQIQIFFTQYFQVEYEIDNLMESISAYFN